MKIAAQTWRLNELLKRHELLQMEMDAIIKAGISSITTSTVILDAWNSLQTELILVQQELASLRQQNQSEDFKREQASQTDMIYSLLTE